MNKPATPRKPADAITVPRTARTCNLRHGNYTEFDFMGKVPGNNGKGGLLRMHWATKAKLLAGYIWVVRSRTTYRHPGPVRLELTRYSIGSQMDYDNLVSTGKLLLDAVVRAGVLPDDNPQIITERHYSQERAASKEAQCTVLRITDLPALTQLNPSKP